jgi:hypothetical protein
VRGERGRPGRIGKKPYLLEEVQKLRCLRDRQAVLWQPAQVEFNCLSDQLLSLVNCFADGYARGKLRNVSPVRCSTFLDYDRLSHMLISSQPA